MYISSPLCEAIPEPESPVPWLSDCDSREEMAEPDLRTFAHICRVRSLQSFFMHMVEKEALEDSVPLELEMHMLNRLREWEDAEVIARHRYVSRVLLRNCELSVFAVCRTAMAIEAPSGFNISVT
jgi:hypothetical protein